VLFYIFFPNFRKNAILHYYGIYFFSTAKYFLFFFEIFDYHDILF